MKALGRGWRPGKGVFLSLAFLAGFAADFLTKRWAQSRLAAGSPIQIIAGFFELRYVENTGVAFSLLRSLPAGTREAVIYTFNGVAILGILALLRRWWGKGLAGLLPLASILSGAIGNLYDRLAYGHVVDFLHLHYQWRWSWPIFNVADLLIDLGVVFLLLLNRDELYREVCRDDEPRGGGKARRRAPGGDRTP